jgi:diguanylate cyclase (GGDEF)-like protein
MVIDLPTLMLSGGFVACCAGALLLLAWWQYRESVAALWWAGADATMAFALALMAIGAAADNAPSIRLGLALLCLSSSLSWAGARAFDGLTIHPVLLMLGTAVWVAADVLTNMAGSALRTSILNATVTLIYYCAAAFTLWRHKGEALRARTPLVVLLTLHALALTLAIPACFAASGRPNDPPQLLGWFAIVHFETIIFLMGTALFLVAMMKERSEGRHADASMTDPLTGLLNRRGFHVKASRILARAASDGVSVSVIVFDVDHFKRINDSFGHAIGDEVLATFSETCVTALRPSDVVGRIGGEEFAAILPGCGAEAAFALAERVRRCFSRNAECLGEHMIRATLSAGLACCLDNGKPLGQLIDEADRALYQAKKKGRDRVAVFDDDRPSDPSGSNVVRVA